MTLLLAVLLAACVATLGRVQAQSWMYRHAHESERDESIVQVQPWMRTLTNGRVTAVLDECSGRFAARTADGRTLLFARGGEATSHISVLIDGTIHTNYGKSQMTAPWPRRNLGRGVVERLADRLRCTWRIAARGGEARLVLELEPVSDGAHEELRVHVTVENATPRALHVGMTVMEDVEAAGDDNVRLRHVAELIGHERVFRGGDVPERMMMQSGAFAPDSAFCRFRGEGVSTPDAVTVGEWSYHGRLGTAVYGYEATGFPIWDTALLLQWDARELPGGGSRTESTAIALQAPRPDTPGASSFAREFVVPMHTNVALLSIVSDSVATVRVSAPYAPGWFDSDFTLRDGPWEETVTVAPDKPVGVAIRLATKNRLNTDSVTFYRQHHVVASADREIGLVVRPLAHTSMLDANLLWPVAWWDTLYLYHGTMEWTWIALNDGGRENTLNIHHTLRYDVSTYSDKTTEGIPIGGVFNIDIPAGGHVDIQRGNERRRHYNHWDPLLPSDGAGDLLTGRHLFHIGVTLASTIYPGVSTFVGSFYDYFQERYFHQPSRRQLGTEYVFVPFRKQYANKQEDLLRVMAYEDDTEVTLFDGTPPIRLDRGVHIDTLLSQATVIRSSKPVAVHQHEPGWQYMQADTVRGAGAFALLPPGLWGRRYFAYTNDLFETQRFRHPVYDFQDGSSFFKTLYLLIITRVENAAGVLLNGVPVDESEFTSFGEWAYAYLDITPGYHIVSSGQPLLTVVCGGGNAVPSTSVRRFAFGMSWIPAFK